MHLAKRGSALYRTIVKGSGALQKTENVKSVKVSAGDIKISSSDGVKSFLRKFSAYLEQSTTLGQGTIKAQVRVVGDVIRQSLPLDTDFVLTGSKLCQVMQKMDDPEPPGLLYIKRQTFSANYIRKISYACTRAVEFLASSDDKNLQITDDERKTTFAILKATSG